MHNLKKASRSRWNKEYNHSYDPKDYARRVEVSSLAGPIYSVDQKHTYGHDYGKKPESAEMHGPIYQGLEKHSYGKDFSAPHKMETKGRVHDVGRRHQVCIYQLQCGK